LIAFVSNKFVEVSPGNYEVDGDFAIRRASNPEELTLIVAGKGTA
jgi:polyisoprenoid-binding protein YceI